MEENKENVVEEIQSPESSTDDNVVKVDMSAPVVTQEDDVIKVDLSKPVGAEATEESVNEEPAVEEIIEEPPLVVEEPTVKVEEPVVAPPSLPEGVEKLVAFMEETGGNLNDYVELNRDFAEMDNLTALREYYKKTKPHLSEEDVQFLMDDQFTYNEELDADQEIRRKKLALKEQVAEARDYLEGMKSKYYEDLKAGSKLTEEQREAIEFFNRYNEESEASQKILDSQVEAFQQKTNNVFNDEFKGFEFKVGDKRFRYNVNNVDKVKESQSDINNFVKKFLNKENVMEDAAGYHKALYTATNADAIANHFYEQGRSDALKESIAKSKNVDMTPRQSHSANEDTGGIKVRALGDSSEDFKFKIRKKN
jgi:hypothetical protein